MQFSIAFSIAAILFYLKSIRPFTKSMYFQFYLKNFEYQKQKETYFVISLLKSKKIYIISANLIFSVN